MAEMNQHYYPTTAPTSSAGRWVVTSFGGPSVLKWQELPLLPNPGPDAARVRILICGVSGADNIMRAGGYTRVPQTQKPGFTPGYEILGVVEELGEGSSGKGKEFQVGDIVASITVVGGYATHAVVPLDDLLKLQEDDDFVKVAALPLNYMTAHGMMKHSAFPLDQDVACVLIGSVAGGVGTALAQLIRVLYPDVTIFGTCSPEKFAFARSLGVRPVDRSLPTSELITTVKAWTGGKGVDRAYEMVGSPNNMNAFLSCTVKGTGRMLAIGFMANIKVDGSGLEAMQFDPVQWCIDNSDHAAFFSVTNMYWRGQRAEFKHDFEEVMLKLVRTNHLVPRVTKCWRLDQVVELNEMLATGRGVVGKHEIIVDRGGYDEYARNMKGNQW